MASIINATTTNGVAISADNSGILQLATNSGTTALTLSVAQAATFVSSVTATSLTAPILSSATTLSLQTNGSTTAVTIDASQIISLANALPVTSGGTGNTTGATNYTGFKNRIINGAMVIDQRNAGASVTPTNNQYLVDRFSATLSQASKYSVQQNAGAVTPPIGFINYLGVTSLSAYSILTGDTFSIAQAIEGFNVADLNWGTTNAQTVTLSFRVYSSLTGTFGGAINNTDGTRGYPFSYSIPVANTWTQVSITITGDTTGNWLKNNGNGLKVNYGLGVGATGGSGTAGSWQAGLFVSATGATSVVGTSGATFYITGVQLEKGSTATSFDYRPYGTELALCQRYLPAWNMTAVNQVIGQGQATATTSAAIYLPFKVSTRVPPTGTSTSAASTFYLTASGYTVAGTVSTISGQYYGTEGAEIGIGTSSGLVGGNCTTLASNATSSQILFTGCEL